ncbi:MAG: hypothetical protein J2P29_09020, partial [Actinobacteria bacterium]|nr:hypothetical protein [Actinomycetota bacterium]
AVIPEGGAAMLRVCAQRDGDTVIAVLRCSQSSYRVDHAAATFSCEQAGMPDSPVAVGSSAVPPLVSAAATGLVDGAELYGPVCFQAGPFRRIALLPEITPRSGRAIARGADEQPWFATGGTLDSASFLLGSPGLNDAVLQVLQACVPHRRIRLVSCESVQFAGRDVTGPVEIRAIAGPIRPADRADRADRADYADRPDRPGYADRPDHGNGAIGANGANGATSVSLSDGFNKVPLSELLNPAPPGAHRRPRQPGKLRTWRSTPPGQAGNGELDRRSRTAMGEATRSDLQVTRADAIRADSGPAGRQLWSVEAVNGAGQLLASWRGIRLADAGPLPRNSPWPPTLLAVFLERCAADLGLDAGLRVTISCGQPDVPTAAIPRQSVSTGDGLPDFRDRTASGRHAGPERRGINTVTARGTGQLAGFTLTARAPTPVSCAWVAVGDTNHRPHSAELTAVAHQFRAEFGEEPAVLEARLQAIRGCLAAADVQADSQLRVTHATSDGWATLATRRTRIVSTLVEVSGVAAPIAVALLTTRRAHARTAAANLPSTVPPR